MADPTDPYAGWTEEPAPEAQPPKEDQFAGWTEEPAAPQPTREQTVDEENQALGNLFKHGLQEAPDKRAGVLALSRESGVSPDIVEANYDAIKSSWEAQKFNPAEWRKANPQLAKLVLEQPHLGTVVMHDAKLSLFSKAWNKFTEWSADVDRAIGPTRSEAERTAEVDAQTFKPGPAQKFIDDPKAKALRESGDDIFGYAAKAVIPYARYLETKQQLDISKKQFELMTARARGQDTYALEKEIVDLKQNAIQRDYGEGPVAQVFTDVATAAASSLDVLKQGGIGAAVVGGAVGLATLAATRNPSVAGRVALKGASIGGKVGAVAGTFRLETGDAYGELLDARTDDGKPLDNNVATGAAVLYGALASAIEFASWGPMLKAMGPLGQLIKTGEKKAAIAALMKDQGFKDIAKRVGKDWLASSAAEGGEEFLQSIAQDASEYLARSYQQGSLSAQHDVKASIEKGLVAGQQGFVGGAGLATVSVGTHLATMSIARDNAHIAGQQVAALAGLKDSPSVRAAPEAVADMIAQSAATDGSPVTHVYVEPQAFTRLFQEQNGDATQAIAELMGAEGPRLLQEAIATGQKLEVPIADYLSKWGPKDVAQALAKDTTTRPQLPTPTQLEEIQKQADELAKENTPPETKGEAQWLDAVEKQLATVQGEGKAAARKQMMLMRAFVRTQSEVMGRDAGELFSNLALSVVPGDEAPSVTQAAPIEEGDASFDTAALDAQLQNDAKQQQGDVVAAQGVVDRMRSGEKKALAQKLLAYMEGKGEQPKATTDEERKTLDTLEREWAAEFGLVDPERGYTFDQHGKTLERPIGGRRTFAEIPDALGEHKHNQGGAWWMPYSAMKKRRFEQTDPAAAASLALVERWRSQSAEQKTRDFYVDITTGALNERAWKRLPKGERQTAAISIEGVKYVNDNFGHEAGNDVYRAAAQALAPFAPELAKVKGDFALYVKDQSELDAILAQANADPALQGFQLSGAVGEDLRSASSEANNRKAALEKEGKRAPRGTKPLSAKAEKLAAARLEGTRISDFLSKELEGITDEAVKFNEAFIEESTGLLTKDGFDRLPPKAFRASIDLNGIADFNNLIGKETTDFIIEAFGHAMREAGGADFDAAHISGDEYAAQADTEEELQKYLAKVEEIAVDVMIGLELSDDVAKRLNLDPKEKHAVDGLPFGAGVGKNIDDAERALQADKERLSREGKRGPGAAQARIRELGSIARAREGRSQGRSQSDTRDGGGQNVPAARRQGYVSPTRLEQSQTESQAFKSWFKDSKVVDENGKPLRVFHGSAYTGAPGAESFNESLQDKTALFGPGFYFTADPEVASSYVDKEARALGQKGETPGVVPAFLSIQTPIDADAPAASLIPQLKKFKPKNPPAQIKRMIDSALKDETSIGSADGVGAWIDNTEWAYNLADKMGKNGDEIARPHFDYILSKARDYIVKGIQSGEFKTGEDVLKHIEHNVFEVMQNDAGNVRQVLEMLGFDGITHTGGGRLGGGDRMHKVWIAFKPNQIKSATGNRGTFDPNNPSVLFAGGETGNPRGYTELLKDAQKRVIKIALNKNADLSTFLHEMGHVFLELTGDLAELPDSPARLKEDWGTTLKWLGASSRNGITRDMHEKWARGFERYLMEGKAPSVALAGAFERFKLWLRNIYKGLSSLGVELNDDVRGVFDRLLATDKEIRRVKAQMGITAPLARDILGMSLEEYAAHLEKWNEAVRHAERQAELTAMKDRLRENEGWWKDEAKKEKAKAEAEYEELPARKAQQTLAGKSELSSTPVALDKETVVAALGPEGAKAFKTKKNGANPDELAELLGYPTGKAMLDAVASLPDKAKWVKGEVLNRMSERHSDVLTDRLKLTELVSRGLHGEQTLKWLEREWAALSLKSGDRLQPIAVIKEAARKMAAATRVGNLNTGQALAAERAAANAAAKAAAKGNYGEAFLAKQRQLLNAYLWRELSEARDAREKFLENAAKLANDKGQAKLGKGRGLYRDGVAGVLEAFGLKDPTETPKPSIGELVQTMAQDGATVVLDEPTVAQLLASPKDWRQLTVSEMRAIDIALKNIKGASNARATVLVDGKRFEKGVIVDQALQEAAKNLPPKPPMPSSKEARSGGQKFSAGVAGIDGSLLRIETMIDWLAGGDLNSIWHRAFIKPMQQAKAREADLLKKTIKPIVDAFEKVPKSVRTRFQEKVDGKALFPTHKVGLDQELEPPTRRFELLMMALNAGNESNLSRLLEGRNITMAQLQKAFELLTKEEFDWVQSLWDASESLWPESSALEERDTGLVPEKLELRPLITKFGSYRGGYFPAVYDRRVEAAGERQVANQLADMMDPSFTRPGTARSHLKSRVDGFTGAISLSPGTISRSLAQVAHDIAFRETVKSVGNLVLDPKIQAELARRLGDERRQQFLQWVKDVGTMRGADGASNAGVLLSLFRKLKGNTVVAVLGYSVPTAAGDLANLVAVMPRSGLQMKHWSAGLLEFMRSPVKAIADAEAKSGELRTRRDQMQREFHKQVSELTETGPFARGPLKWMKHHAFGFMEFTDLITSTPIWMGAYRQALAKGRAEDAAVEFADSVVRRNFPSHSAVDKAGVLRDKGFIGSSLLFYGYFNVLYNGMRDLGHQAAQSDKASDKARLGGRMLAYMAFAVVFSELLSGRGPEPDEDWATWFLRKLLVGSLASVPGGGDIATLGEGAVLNKRVNPRQSGTAGYLGEIGVAAIKLAKAASDDKELDKYMANLARTSGPITGIPLSQPMRTLGYLNDLMIGDEEPRGPGDVVGGVLYGKKKTPSANLPTMMQDMFEGQAPGVGP